METLDSIVRRQNDQVLLREARGRVTMYRETICHLVNGTAEDGQSEAEDIIQEMLSAIYEERRDFPGRV